MAISDFAANIEMWWTHLPFLDRIDAAADAGFMAIEIWEYQGKDIDGIIKRLEKHQMELTQFTAWGWDEWFNDPSNLIKIKDQIEEACQLAKRLGCKMGTIVGGDDQPGMTQTEMHEQIAHVLALLAPKVEAADFTLILEPMNIRVDHAGHCLYSSKPAIAICDAVNSSHIKLNWDLYHMQISEGDLCGHIREGIHQIGYMQLADHPGRHEPGTGEINYSRVLSEARKLGYQGYFGLECTPLNNEPEAIERLKQLEIIAK